MIPYFQASIVAPLAAVEALLNSLDAKSSKSLPCTLKVLIGPVPYDSSIAKQKGDTPLKLADALTAYIKANAGEHMRAVYQCSVN